MTNKDAIYTLKKIAANVEKIIIGKRHAIELLAFTLICRGHALIEDAPGVGKTSMVSALAKSINASFKRVQFTPDIMPSDITGFSVFNPGTGEFEYRPGAVSSQFVLADEINRASPKTQSSLLEVMEENQVTVDGVTHKTPRPFIVLATQNPIEYLGTYPLPEAQLDRFFMKISLGYPTEKEESRILERFREGAPEISHITESENVILIQSLVEKIHVSQEINKFIVAISRFTRESEDVVLGASPRASLCLFKASQARALYNERDFVTPDDVINLALPVLSHRIILKQEAKLRKKTSDEIVKEAVNATRSA